MQKEGIRVNQQYDRPVMAKHDAVTASIKPMAKVSLYTVTHDPSIPPLIQDIKTGASYSIPSKP